MFLFVFWLQVHLIVKKNTKSLIIILIGTQELNLEVGSRAGLYGLG